MHSQAATVRTPGSFDVCESGRVCAPLKAIARAGGSPPKPSDCSSPPSTAVLTCPGDRLRCHDSGGHRQPRVYEAADLSDVQLPLFPDDVEHLHLRAGLLHLHHPHAHVRVRCVTV